MGESMGEDPVNSSAEAGDQAEFCDPSMADDRLETNQTVAGCDSIDFTEPSAGPDLDGASGAIEPESPVESTNPIGSTNPTEDGHGLPTEDGLPRVPTQDGQPRHPTEDGQPQVPTQDEQPQPQTEDGQPQVPTQDEQPQPQTEDGQPQVPAQDGLPQTPTPDEQPQPQAECAQPQFPAALTFEAETLYVDGLIETVKALEAHEARIHALRAFVLSELCEHFRQSARDRLEAAEAPTLTASEVAAALNVSQRTGRAMVEEARALADPSLAPLMDALREGQLDRRRARAVMEHAAVLPPGKGTAFAAAAVELGCPQGDPARAPSPGAFARRLRRLAEDFHPEPLAARKAHATAFRRVDVEATKDGMCWITAHLPLEAGAAIDTRLEAVARSLQAPGEIRGIGQLRADVFRDLLLNGTLPGWDAGADSPDGVAGSSRATSRAAEPGATRPAPAGSTSTGIAGGVRMEVVVTVPARTLTGESEASAEILGYGALDAPAARLLAAEAATWTTMWVHPGTGVPLGVGRRRYTPPLAIRRFLGARDRTCRFPGCDKPAQSGEVDHTVPWQHGGATDTANLAVLCREHHRLKSLGHWKLKQLDSGPSKEEIVDSPATHGNGCSPGTTATHGTGCSPGTTATHGTGCSPGTTATHGTGCSSGTPDGGESCECGGSGSEISRLPSNGSGRLRPGVNPLATEPAPPSAPNTRSTQPSAVNTLTTLPTPPGGILEWTSPAGRKYVTYPETDAPPPF